MGKGLPYSLSRGEPIKQDIVKRTITVRDLILTLTGVTGTVVFQTAVLQGLPEGNLQLLGAVANLGFAGPGSSADLGDTWAGDFSIGSSPTADNSLAGAEVDIVPKTAIGPASSEVIAVTRGALAAPVMLDNTANTMELNLNLIVDADDIANSKAVDITVNGELYLAYIVLGDD